jgi:hypothetical protein
MPQPDPAERVVDRREPGDDAQAALQRRLQLGQRDVRARLDEAAQIALMRRQQPPPKRAGAALPVVRTRCISLIAADGLTAKRRAASRIELPPSTDRTIRTRRSNDIGAGMTIIPFVSTVIVESQAPIP